MLISPNEPILPVHHYPRALVQFMAGYGVERNRLLEGAQIPEAVFSEENATISYTQYGVMIMNALRYFPGPSLGLAFGKALNIAQHGMLGVAIMTSDTLKDALAIMEKYYSLLSPIVSLSSQVVGNECVARADQSWEIGPLQAMATETFFSGIYENCEFLLGEKIPAVFYFRHEKPAYSDLYKSLFGDKCHFECASDQIVFDKAWLERSIKWSNPTTCKQALEICDAELEQINGRESLLLKLRNLPIVSEKGVLPLDAAAEALHMSGRSLRRRLRSLNTSYQQLSDKLRAEAAEELLRDRNIAIAEVAEKLGFNDVANFRKTFKRWMGKTPSEFRKGIS